ncbi:MAG: hypothetical protein COV44_10345 [Deltaproteobacteria bacterium CG11_big_fil_rev_8_21_14_0_20_45_16]|nr:MAG: hypothetical protein COV44_10345 [Deltaproteobacteria bacterium CG11_big_fil_rev_8_21_14_0_20_45_16]
MNDSKGKPKKAYLGILFECCKVYSRVYRESDQDYYEGRCPKCMRKLHVRVDPSGGSRERIWRAR